MAPSLGIVKKQNGSQDPGSKRGLRKRDILSYALLPKVLPRMADLFFNGFYFFAFFMAQVYRGVRLLPADHPSLNPSNIGQFGIRDVIGEAARHLVWRKENIDQIIVFLAILLGLVLLVLQAATFVVALAVPQASAATGIGFSSMFGSTFGGSQDIAFILLDRVFGVPGVFDSCISTATPCYGVSADTLKFDTTNTVYKPPIFPWPYHDGLHALFQFYSMGLLLVAVFILIYFVIVIVAETAQTGTPFGKRFNTVWAPIRLVMAFGLLIPISNGLNSAQYITLYAAKWGSNFATNGWILFNDSIQDSAENMAQGMDLTIKPKEPDVAGLLQFMTAAHECKIFEETIMKDPVLDPTATSPTCGDDKLGRRIEAYVVKPGFDPANSARPLKSLTYQQALDFGENTDIQIRFGTKSCRKDYSKAGNIEPTCGEVTLPINSLTEVGAMSIQEGYYGLIKYLWGGFGSGNDVVSYRNTTAPGTNQDSRPERNACIESEYNAVLDSGQGSYDKAIRKYALSNFQNGIDGPDKGKCEKNDATKKNEDYDLLDMPPDGWMIAATKHYSYGSEDAQETTSVDTNVSGDSSYEGSGGGDQFIVRNILRKGVRDLRDAIDAGEYNVSDDNLRRGWAVAGIWYNKIAEMNGALIGAAWDIPVPNRYPQMMMTVLAEKKQNNEQVSAGNMFCPDVAGGNIKLPMGQNGEDYALELCKLHGQWGASKPQQSTGNVFADTVNSFFGLQGLFDLRYQDNNRSHPLAMLVGVGKGLIEASIRNLGGGVFFGLGAIATGLSGTTAVPELLSAISSFLFSVATMTLTAGFILFYVIPFLPFLYFFFAVGNWLKGVFEAMVGVPLWALAHLRIDGNGLPGEAAINGYFMLFEIFLRPLLIVFGFLASITIFAAMATVLHEVFKIAVDNLTGSGTGAGASKAIDNFFYTIMYAVIMYIMALSSFKLIDLIPNQIMRWMGTTVSTFSDLQGDAAGNLTNMTAIAGSQIVGGMTNGLSGGMKSLSGIASKTSAGLQGR